MSHGPKTASVAKAGVLLVCHGQPDEWGVEWPTEKVVFFLAAIGADSIHSQFDIPVLVYEAAVGDDMPTLNHRAWNDDPIVIEAISENLTC